jgi:hypothetical protein
MNFHHLKDHIAVSNNAENEDSQDESLALDTILNGQDIQGLGVIQIEAPIEYQEIDQQQRRHFTWQHFAYA